jgi:hypothetical protein
VFILRWYPRRHEGTGGMTQRRTEPGGTPDLGPMDSLDLARPGQRAPLAAPAPRRAWPWVLLLAALAVAGVLALLLGQWREQIGERLVPDSAINVQIELAQQALARGELSRDDGSGARERFQAVLARDPDHLAARTGMAAVRDAALAQARAAIGRGDAATARARIEMARGMAAPASGLAILEQDLQRIESTGADVAELLERARAAQAEGRIEQLPDGALVLYLDVLQRQPDNALALLGRGEILSGLVLQAEQALARGDLGQAEALAARVVEADPSHLELPALQARLGDARQQRLRETEALLATAVAARRAGRLEAAAEAFRALLAADPASADARRGLDDTAAAMALRAGREAADFDFDAAEASLRLARGWQPASPAIAGAERRLAQARSAQGQLPAANPERLAGLVEQARTAMRQGDLIEPPGASAWDFLRQASAIAPGSMEVRAVLAEYDRRALACFEDELAGNRLSRAQSCLDARAARDAGSASLMADRRRLADRWLAFADERLGANELALARRALNFAQALDPSHPGLVAIAERLARAGG